MAIKLFAFDTLFPAAFLITFFTLLAIHLRKIVSTILESDVLRVVAGDRGYGIPKGEQEKIWQKFYRVARDGQDKEEESTGVGLSMVKEIVEQHGGAVESEPSGGSKLRFTLPRL